MKILVLNCGSSSIKYKLFDMDSKEVMAQGGIERIGLQGSFLKFALPNGEKVILEREIPEHTVGIEFVLETLTGEKYGCISSLDDITAVGHRVVHGGEKFNSSVLITQDVVDQMVQCSELAPLHNPANLKGIYTISKLLPNVPQVGVFDTAFHQSPETEEGIVLHDAVNGTHVIRLVNGVKLDRRVQLGNPLFVAIPQRDGIVLESADGDGPQNLAAFAEHARLLIKSLSAGKIEKRVGVRVVNTHRRTEVSDKLSAENRLCQGTGIE